ncbi:MAG: HAD family hydrolase [Anaerolineaceae bacterium]|nr:MAG: HAD family hydrolase [Anaerolineaceae bacterium]
MFETIAFDADDTLWHNEIHYQEAKKQFSQLLSKYQGADYARQRLDETEVKNIDIYGYGIKMFTLSMIETAIDLSDGRITGPEIRQLIDIAKEMLTNEVELFEHAEETLEKLIPRFDLMLITKGDYFEQERKIALSGLSGYFRYIEIVMEKSQEIYQSILAKHDIHPHRLLMVGNSLRSDIQPVLAIGGRAVYIPNEQTWFHENLPVEEVDPTAYDELEHIAQLPDLIDRLMKDETAS